MGLVLGCAAYALSLLSEHAKETLHTKGRLHLWLHLAIFSALGALAMLSSARVSSRVLLLAGAMLLGLSIEYSEAARFHNPFELYDVVTDSCGVLLGAAAGGWLSRRSS